MAERTEAFWTDRKCLKRNKQVFSRTLEVFEILMYRAAGGECALMFLHVSDYRLSLLCLVNQLDSAQFAAPFQEALIVFVAEVATLNESLS